MGIDKPNINYTFHYGLPSSVEALYQEAGRAGRWDKAKFPDKQAKCYLFYSKETTEYSNVEKLFDKDTTFAEIKVIRDKVGWDGKDIFRQMFLFLQEKKDIAEDFKIMNGVIEHFFKPNSKSIIWLKDAKEKIGIKDDVLEKAIYRLSLLGIIKDWTKNFTNHYNVEFLTIDDDSMLRSISNYVLNYEPGLKLEEELNKLNHLPTVKEKCIWFLLQWTFENITYNRKQSLKTIADWCTDFAEIGNEKFKARIDNYFRFTETTFVYQHITENPKDFQKWFDVFIKIEKDKSQKEIRVFIPTIKDDEKKQKEFERLRDSLSRFLESYKNSTGLNFVSGLVRLFLKNYKDKDGLERFESALENIKKDFSKEEQDVIINRVIEIGLHLEETEKVEMSLSIIKYYPSRLEELVEKYELYYLYNDRINKKLQQLKLINHHLYEYVTEI